MEVGRAELRSHGVVVEMGVVEGTAGESNGSRRVRSWMESGAREHRLCVWILQSARAIVIPDPKKLVDSS